MVNPVPEHVIAELAAKLPDFRRGYEDEGLHVDEYDEFGPVELFRSIFVKSWQQMLDVIHKRREAIAMAAA